MKQLNLTDTSMKRYLSLGLGARLKDSPNPKLSVSFHGSVSVGLTCLTQYYSSESPTPEPPVTMVQVWGTHRVMLG